jgi:hypothetical protein
MRSRRGPARPAHTSRMRLGAAVAQLPARAPAATAMVAMTLDHLSDERFVLSLGSSGPRVAEGWYGQPFTQCLGRVREYVKIVRTVVARQQPLTHRGRHSTCPPRTALPWASRWCLRCTRSARACWRISAPKATSPWPSRSPTAGWRCSWLPAMTMPYAPLSRKVSTVVVAAVRASRWWPLCRSSSTVISTALRTGCGRRWRCTSAAWAPPGANFHHNAFVRKGFPDAARRIQERYLVGRKREAEAATPTTLTERFALIGPPAKICHDLQAWQGSVVDTLAVDGLPDDLEQVAGVLNC